MIDVMPENSSRISEVELTAKKRSGRKKTKQTRDDHTSLKQPSDHRSLVTEVPSLPPKQEPAQN